MTVTISALFDDYARASEAVKNLELAGLPSDDISIVANNTDGQYDPARPHISRVVGHDRDRDGVDDRVEGAEAGAGIGAAVGGVAGLLAGTRPSGRSRPWTRGRGRMACLPGSSCRGRGRRRRDHRCAQPIGRHRRRRSSLCGGDSARRHTCIGRVPEAERRRYEAILHRLEVALREREADYRSAGWTRYDPAAPAYTAEEIRGERERFRSRV